MKTLYRTLALVSVSALAACGGGSSGAVSPVVNATTAPAKTQQNPNASATVTFKFPAHVARAKTTASGRKLPAYINPNGSSIVITAKGATVIDPSSGNPYFSLNVQNLTTGTSTLTVPLVSGTYNTDDLVFTEYDAAGGTGDVIAIGGNEPYTDGNGNIQPGSFTITPGGSATPLVTMAMNVTNIVMTTDPINGTGAQVLPNNGSTTYCASSGTTYWFFPADASGTFVVPGSATGAGYSGGDSANSVPGIATVKQQGQYPIYSGQPATFNSTAFGVNAPAWTYYSAGGYLVYVTLFVQNSAAQTLNNPLNLTPTIYTYLNIGANNCE